MEKILNTKRGRRNFYTICSLFLIVLLLIRFFVLTENEIVESNLEYLGITKTIIDGLFTSLLTTVGLTFFYFSITPKDDKRLITLIEKAYFREKAFKSARKNADYWKFNGGIGRYTRTETLPELDKISKKKKENLDVILIIMNPNNNELCEKYASYKKSLDHKNKHNWTKELTRNNLFATILKSTQYENQSNFLNISIYVKNHFSLMRTELTQNKIILTKEDPSVPLILLEKKSYLYSPYKEDLNQILIQSKLVEITKVSELNKPINEITFDDAKSFFNNMSIKSPNDNEIKEILEILKCDKNPFSLYKNLIY